MARPAVMVSAPQWLFVGRESAFEIQVTPVGETKIDFIEARLEGDHGWTVGSGKSQVSVRVKAPRLGQQLMGPGVLKAGETTRFVARFVLPSGTPPTHEIGPAWSRMQLYLHISIPWHLDGRHKYDFAVRLPPPEHVARLPVMVRSTAEPGKPRIELGLAAAELVAGEELVGTCAVFHLDDAKPREVDLALVPELELYGRGRGRERRGREIAATMTIPAGGAGTNTQFRLVVPANLTPSFAGASHQLRWWLVARTGSFFSGRVDVAVPLIIVDRSAAATTPRLSAAPRLGDERIATLFARFAARNAWKGAEPEGDDFAIEKPVGAATLRIAYAYRGEAGTVLVATVHVPSLGLGLAVAPSSSLRHMFWKDVEVNIDAWDRAHHVAARYPEQAIPFLRGVVPVLMRAPELGTMIRWNDSEVVFEREVADVRDEELGVAAAQLELIALSIAEHVIRIPSPPSLAVDLASWRSLATWLGGTLALGDLGIHGALDGARVDLGVLWQEGAPASIHAAVGDPNAASDELRTAVVRLARPASDVLAANAAERLVELCTRWPQDVVDLAVEQGVASASLRLPPGDVPVADAGRARSLVEGLRAVLAALDPGSGPYR